ncbi:MAG TPA: SPFH domain-containing protein, partial [Vicinamibacteria bacterium]|nr:SPFH domain-containing protein [Vicinamibacteria bacterium]
MIRERERYTAPGLLLIVVFLAVAAAAVAGIVHAAQVERPVALVGFVLLAIVDVVAAGGLFTVAPNEGQVLQLFGAYRGTAKDEGLRWANPFYTKKRISLR